MCDVSWFWFAKEVSRVSQAHDATKTMLWDANFLGKLSERDCLIARNCIKDLEPDQEVKDHVIKLFLQCIVKPSVMALDMSTYCHATPSKVISRSSGQIL